MAENQKTIYVYDDFSFDEPILLGQLYVSVIKGGDCNLTTRSLLQIL